MVQQQPGLNRRSAPEKMVDKAEETIDLLRVWIGRNPERHLWDGCQVNETAFAEETDSVWEEKEVEKALKGRG